jgi:regulator of sirC expression with transglutaminase-like and TPR domain
MTTLSSQDLQAVIRLMTDQHDSDTLPLLRQQLQNFEIGALRELQGWARQAPDHVAMEIEQALRLRIWEGVEARLREQAASAAPDLLELLVLLASFGRPELEPATIRRDLAEMHVLADCRLDRDELPLERALALADLLGNELKFHAHANGPECPEHYYLDRVLVSREGSPILLGCLYLILGERVGVPLQGVALPQLFVVAVHNAPSDPQALLYLDPSRRGLVLSRLDIVEAVEKAGGTFHEEFLKPVGTRLIFGRILHNLCANYARSREDCRGEMLQRYMNLWAPGATC